MGVCCICVWPKDGKLYKVILWFCVVSMAWLCFCLARMGLLFLSSPSTRFASDLKRALAPSAAKRIRNWNPGISALQTGLRTPIHGFTFPNWNPFECVDFKVNCLGIDALLSSRTPNWTKQTLMPRPGRERWPPSRGRTKRLIYTRVLVSLLRFYRGFYI